MLKISACSISMSHKGADPFYMGEEYHSASQQPHKHIGQRRGESALNLPWLPYHPFPMHPCTHTLLPHAPMRPR